MITDCMSFKESISCSWASEVPQGTVVFGKCNDPAEWDEDGGIIHVVNEENFIQLEKMENEPCTLKVTLADHFAKITNISLVSEARIIEIYGKYGEYLKTCKCEHISEAHGKNIYGAQTDLLTSQEISFKFPGAQDGILLCGIKILLMDSPPPIPSSFDYNLVDDKLKKSNIPITEKAEQFKKFLQDYASSKHTKSGTNFDPQLFMKIMEGECMSHLRPVEAASRNFSRYLSHLLPSMKTDEKEGSAQSEKDEIQEKSKAADNEKTRSDLKEYVDDRINQLEEKLENNFKKQIEDQNEKLDAILNLLQKSALSST